MARINLPLTANEVGLTTTASPALDVVDKEDPSAVLIVVERNGAYLFESWVAPSESAPNRRQALELKRTDVADEAAMLALTFGHGETEIFTGDEIFRLDNNSFYKFGGTSQGDVAILTKWILIGAIS